MIFNQGRSLRRRARSTVVCALVFFVLFQLLFDLIVQKHRIDLRDPEFGYKLTTLKGSVRRDPDRPLVLILGSSRTELGIIPSELHLAGPAADKDPLVFNMSLAGSGPLLELLCLKRVLAEGIHPRWIMIEVLPVTLFEEPAWSDMTFLNVNRLSLDEVPLLCKYNRCPTQLRMGWIECHAAPLYTHRFVLMNHFAPRWLPVSLRKDDWRRMDQNGYRYGVFVPPIDENYLQFLRTVAEKQYLAALRRFSISDKSNQAMHELLELCRDQHIPALLYLMPEGERFRSWYPPAVQAAIGNYLENLTREYGLPLVDARTWFHEEDFVDSHHFFEPSAWAFSKKLGAEVNQNGFLDKNSLTHH